MDQTCTICGGTSDEMMTYEGESTEHADKGDPICAYGCAFYAEHGYWDKE